MTDVIPDRLTALSGWRAWRVIDGKLTSITDRQVWTPVQAFEAKCTSSIPGSGPGVSGLFMTTAPFFLSATSVNPNASAGPAAFPVQAMQPQPRRSMISGAYGGLGEVVDEIEHEVPDPSCSCGIYAASTLLPVWPYVDDAVVVGRVALWGRVVEHAQGWRAQFAYPQALFVPKPWVTKAARLLKAYELTVQDVEDIQEPWMSGGMAAPYEAAAGKGGFMGLRQFFIPGWLQ